MKNIVIELNNINNKILCFKCFLNNKCIFVVSNIIEIIIKKCL